MATLRPYLCTDCHLSAEVSGGKDALMAGPTQTYYDPATETLFDELLPRYSLVVETKTWLPWVEGEPCPRCGGNLSLDKNNPYVIEAD